ncbi:MAG: LuxR C-terminal-related transcriptional regulator [Ilumatobacteraceae bacterium]
MAAPLTAPRTPSPRPSIDGPASEPLSTQPESRPPRVVVITGHRIVRQALSQALRDRGLDVAKDATTGREGLIAALGCAPLVVLVDATSDPAAGIDTCKQIRRAALNTCLIALVPRLGATLHAAQAAGVDGTVHADVSLDDLSAFIARAPRSARERARRNHPSHRAPSPISRREAEVLSLAAAGLTDAQIASTLVVSVKTAKNHLHNLYAKLGARSRTDAVVIAARQGLITI